MLSDRKVGNSEDRAASSYRVEEGRSYGFLRNVGQFLAVYKMTHVSPRSFWLLVSISQSQTQTDRPCSSHERDVMWMYGFKGEAEVEIPVRKTESKSYNVV